MKAALAIFFCAVLCLSSAEAAGSHSKCETCVRNSHGRIKRSHEATDAFKRSHPCPSTGRASGACPGYVIDHVKPLKRGGADKPSNMQWNTKAEAKVKDKNGIRNGMWARAMIEPGKSAGGLGYEFSFVILLWHCQQFLHLNRTKLFRVCRESGMRSKS